MMLVVVVVVVVWKVIHSSWNLDQESILLLSYAAVLPGLDADNNGIKPALNFVIQNRQTSCSIWCLMYRECY